MLKDPVKTKDEIVAFIREYFAENGPKCDAVIGISGGKDSTVCAALLAEALGRDRVIGVMMPNGVQSDISDSQEVVDLLGIRKVTVNIKAGYDGLSGAINEALREGGIPGVDSLSRDSEINMPPRLRMSTLYAIGQALPNGGRVANTCNRSEDYIGYSFTAEKLQHYFTCDFKNFCKNVQYYCFDIVLFFLNAVYLLSYGFKSVVCRIKILCAHICRKIRFVCRFKS